MNPVAADVSPLHMICRKVRADSRRLLRFRGAMREFIGRNLTPALSPLGRGEGDETRVSIIDHGFESHPSLTYDKMWRPFRARSFARKNTQAFSLGFNIAGFQP